MPSAQEGLSGLAGSRGRAELCLPLCPVALSISVALVHPMASVCTDGYWSWDALEGCLHHPLQPSMGSLPVQLVWTLHPWDRQLVGP